MRNINTIHESFPATEILPETKELFKTKKEYPSVSFLLPVNKLYPKVREEEKKLNAMIKRAEEKLGKQLSAKVYESFAAKFRKIVSTIDFSHLSQSLAVFVSSEKQKVVHLPFRVEEKMIVGNTFELRDLLYAAKHSFHYVAMSLSEKKVRILFGYNHHLSEEEHNELPLGITDTGGKGHSRTQSFTSYASSKHVSDPFQFREKQTEKYLYDIENVFSKIAGKKNIPILLFGERKVTDKFRAITKLNERIIGNVEGNFDQSTPHEIFSKTEPFIKEKFKTIESNALAMLEDAVSRRMSASGIGEVWKAVLEKRGRLLLVEKDYRCPGKIGNNKYTLLVNNVKENGSHILPDAVDEIIEYVLLYGGDVVFVENGSLPVHQRIALITYYA